MQVEFIKSYKEVIQIIEWCFENIGDDWRTNKPVYKGIKNDFYYWPQEHASKIKTKLIDLKNSNIKKDILIVFDFYEMKDAVRLQMIWK